MKYTAITDPDAIRKAQECFVRQMYDKAIPARRTVTWPDGPGDYTVRWRPDERVWMYSQGGENGYWNAFGIEDPTWKRRLRLISEINLAKIGPGRRRRGQFVTDSEGRTYLTHSGGLGGGGKGVGRTTFMKEYSGRRCTVVWPDGYESEYCYIGQLGDDSLPAGIARFVHEVARFKGATFRETPRERALRERLSYIPEPEGKIVVPPKDRREHERRHGIIVNALYRLLSEKREVWKNDRRDLFELDQKGVVRTIIEVKTGMDTSSIYAGIGQLLFHSVCAGSHPKMVLVLPGRPSQRTTDVLTELKIRVLVYHTRQGRLVFPGLDEVLN